MRKEPAPEPPFEPGKSLLYVADEDKYIDMPADFLEVCSEDLAEASKKQLNMKMTFEGRAKAG